MDIFQCIPSFESNEAWQASKTAMFKATGEKYDAGQHFALVKKIAKESPQGKGENTIDDIDLGEKKRARFCFTS